jgi:lysophospholipase L1-like esterase
MTPRLQLGLVLAGLAAGCATPPVDSPEPDVEEEVALSDYVSLGDSYASGTGTRDYYDAECQRSNHAYAHQLTAEKGLNLSHAACSGARIPDVRAKQLGALSAETDLVTISIGGNDAGFGRVIGECAKPLVTCTPDIEGARGFINNTLPGQLDALYTEIKTLAPKARVIVIGYPRLFNGEECNLGARISSDEQRDLNSVADLLAGKISGVAAAHGFDFIDTREPFNAHRICDDVEWLNGLSNPTGESYHPNQLGHDAYTALISAVL